MLRVRRGSAPTFLTGWWFVRTTNGRVLMTADTKDSDLHWLHSVWAQVWGQQARTEGVTVNAETLPVLMSQSHRGDFNAQIFLGVNIAIIKALGFGHCDKPRLNLWVSVSLANTSLWTRPPFFFSLFVVAHRSSFSVPCRIYCLFFLLVPVMRTKTYGNYPSDLPESSFDHTP